MILNQVGFSSSFNNDHTLLSPGIARSVMAFTSAYLSCDGSSRHKE